MLQCCFNCPVSRICLAYAHRMPGINPASLHPDITPTPCSRSRVSRACLTSDVTGQGKGCKDCPMYGVGLNPVYIARMEARQQKKEANGEAEREREEGERMPLVSSLPWQGASEGPRCPPPATGPSSLPPSQIDLT